MELKGQDTPEGRNLQGILVDTFILEVREGPGEGRAWGEGEN